MKGSKICYKSAKMYSITASRMKEKIGLYRWMMLCDSLYCTMQDVRPSSYTDLFQRIRVKIQTIMDDRNSENEMNYSELTAILSNEQ
ncbi:hypothetical protein AB6A40_010686 [Gnathostoma spinigerum]|uniref:Uncharacterized protein n=1 Tax=Gnathostoma spinigerum TaxID=75299 RepID=A0ABD6F363_9BILA